MSNAGQWQIRRVAILSTGTEIMQGQYADSNAQFLAEKFTLAGIQVVTILAAPDHETDVERALRYAGQDVDLVVCTGGLGPTADDVNRFVFAKVFEVPLERDERAIETMAQRFLDRGRGPMPESNEVQAMLPQGCVPLYNKWGTAPGFLLKPPGHGALAGCGLLALPGPPVEMIPMFNELAFPEIQKHFVAGQFGALRTIHTYGHPESEVGALVADLFEKVTDAELTILAKRHGIDLRMYAAGNTPEMVEQRLDKIDAALRSRLPTAMIYGVDDDTLEMAVGRLLCKRKAWVTTAESCTGGMVASMLTSVSGSSAYVGECYVTYSNEAKMRLVGVREETLKAHGAVSEETAREMAEGARRAAGADYGISVTGVAGPGGGSADKPVGLVYIGLAGPNGVKVSRQNLMGDRTGNREQSARIALNMLRLELLG